MLPGGRAGELALRCFGRAGLGWAGRWAWADEWVAGWAWRWPRGAQGTGGRAGVGGRLVEGRFYGRYGRVVGAMRVICGAAADGCVGWLGGGWGALRLDGWAP